MPEKFCIGPDFHEEDCMQTIVSSAFSKPPQRLKYPWVNVVLASVLMLATLPGRTQGLGLITEPLLHELGIERLAYANINLWATLLGAVFCLPAGFLIDRFGLRLVSGVCVILLGLTVWQMSRFAGSMLGLFALVLLTRALGQSALSVISITCVGKSFGKRVGFAMGVYSVLLSMLFAVAFGVVGNSVSARGWREAWFEVAAALLFVVTPLVLIFLREGSSGTRGCLIGFHPAPGAAHERILDFRRCHCALRIGILRVRAF